MTWGNHENERYKDQKKRDWDINGTTKPSPGLLSSNFSLDGRGGKIHLIQSLLSGFWDMSPNLTLTDTNDISSKWIFQIIPGQVPHSLGKKQNSFFTSLFILKSVPDGLTT